MAFCNHLTTETKNKEQNKPIRGIFKMKFSKTRTNEYTFEKIAMFD